MDVIRELSKESCGRIQKEGSVREALICSGKAVREIRPVPLRNRARRDMKEFVVATDSNSPYCSPS